MGRKAAATETVPAERAKHAVPVQKRSRERFELILVTAEDMLKEAGGEAFKMSDLVARSGVPFGSLYQYFPDKTAVIAALAERYNKIAHACVSAALDPVADEKGLQAALILVVDGYYDMFRDYPAMKPIWEATQADRVLQRIDCEDGDYLSGMLLDALLRASPALGRDRAKTIARLAIELIAAAVRHAITLDQREAEESLAIFKHGLPGFVSGATLPR
jgi:AcrR family transcriptional regulator